MQAGDGIMQDKTKTFLDNSCGCGNFLVGLYSRLTEQYGHTHEEAVNRLYGVDLMEDNVRETCRNLGVVYGEHPNFVRANGLTYDYSFDGRTYIPEPDEIEPPSLDDFFS